MTEIVIKNAYGKTVETSLGKFPYKKSTVKKMIKAGYTFWVPDFPLEVCCRKLKQKEIMSLAMEG